jgi:ABC-type polysaccharide/polyol phosphate transport system ATPase subunit
MVAIDISVVGVSKRYTVPLAPPGGLGATIRGLLGKKLEIWALKNVSFSVVRGEALGIVGNNGAGKSTLVKILSGITVPTAGELSIVGRLSALVEVGAGFNIELTGRENVYLGGSILGMGRREISQKMAGIEEFAGIGSCIDAPVKMYSTGQFLRLRFSIAAQLDHDIFILDEVLAVGDVAFQARCFDRIDQLRKDGKTIVLISHDLAAVERICDRAVLLSRGELTMSGHPRDVIEEYSRSAYGGLKSTGSGGAKLCGVHFRNSEARGIQTGGPMTAAVRVEMQERIKDARVTVSIYWPSGYLCTQLSSDGAFIGIDWKGLIEFDFFCPVITLQRGLYRIDVALEHDHEVLGYWRCCALLRVDPGKIILGDFYLAHSCSVRAVNRNHLDELDK